MRVEAQRGLERLRGQVGLPELRVGGAGHVVRGAVLRIGGNRALRVLQRSRRVALEERQRGCVVVRGRGVWRGETDCNAASIGVEIVNPGHEFGYRPFPDAQVASLTALMDDIRGRWTIPDNRIIAHSDLAPERKQDPGELFPWKRLAEAGHGLWFEPAAERIKALGGLLQKGDQGIGVVVLRAGLHRLGYGLQPGGDYDAETETTVRAFQRHWRPGRVDGVADGVSLTHGGVDAIGAR